VPKPERTTGYPYRAPDVLAEHPIAIKLVGGDLERLRGLSESLKGQSIPLIDLVRALRTEDGFTLTGTLYRRRDVRAAPVVYAPPSPTQIAMEAGLTASLNWTHQPELKALLAKLTEQQRSMTEWHHEMDEATRLGRLRQTFRVRSKTIAARPAPSVVALPAASP
jgi:hypothetical protein